MFQYCNDSQFVASPPSALRACALAGVAVLCLAAAGGNACVLAALRRAPSHRPLASLAAADLLLATAVLPVAAATELCGLRLNRILCSIWKALDVLACTASILSLCVLGWERWSGITAPLARARRARRAKLLSILVWPAAGVVALPAVLESSNIVEEDTTCDVNTNIGYVIYSTLFSFYVPTAVMLVFYVKILGALAAAPAIRGHQGRLPEPTAVSSATENNDTRPKTTGHFKQKIQKVTAFLPSNGRNSNAPGTSSNNEQPARISATPEYIHERQRRATRTIVMLMSVFLMCWSPFFIMLPIASLCSCVPKTAFAWCTWLGYTNSALNPIVYACASGPVRRAMRANFARLVRRRGEA